MDKNILTILTTEDREDIKKSLKGIIVDKIKDDFNDKYKSYYIFNPNDLDGMIGEAIKEAKEEIKPLLKEFMLNEMKKKIGME